MKFNIAWILLLFLLYIEPPARPIFLPFNFTASNDDARAVNIGWNVSGMNTDNVKYFSLKVDNDPPLLIKNTTTTVLVDYIKNHTIQLRVIDQCGQVGAPAVDIIDCEHHDSSSSMTLQQPHEVVTTLVQNGAKNGMVLSV